MNDMYRLSGRKAFRTVEEWKSALMTLPEKSFFELLRSVFGNIKTPFNKQRLLDNLFVFLSKDEIRKTIAAYINEQDHKIITAVTILNEPALGKLGNFFAGELSFAELHALVINLEERLILYRFRSEGIQRLALNPVLETVLAPLIADTRLLFPSFPRESSVPKESEAGKESSAPAACITGGRTLAAVFAFILGQDDLFKAEGGLDYGGTQFPGTVFREIRKKVLDEGRKIFPAMDLELVVKALLDLGLVRQEGRGLESRGEKVSDFARLLPYERNIYWSAAIYHCLNEAARYEAGAGEEAAYPGETVHPGLSSRNRLREIASTIHRFAASFNPERKYPEVTLRRFAELCGEDEAGTGNFRLSPTRVRLPFESLLAAMEMAGLLVKTGNYWQMGQGAAFREDNGSAVEGAAPLSAAVIAMDTAFSFILYPEIAFADALEIGAFCSLKESAASEWNLPGGKAHGRDGAVLCFELTRDSVMRGFDQGIKAEDMVKLLDRLSLNRIDPSLGWTLREWENRYAGVSLHQGVILSLAEERRYLAEVEPLASLIERTLAPGVYLLASGERSDAARALRKAGVDIIAQPPAEQGRGPSGIKSSGRGSLPHLETFGGPAYNEISEAGAAAASGVVPETAVSIQEKFRRALEKKQLTKAERDELAARIDRRMVLCETQLDAASLRYEKLEARGLDYPGKTLIARQAVEAGSLVEVCWPGAGGEIQRVLGIAQALEKQEGDSTLVIKNSGSSSVILRIPLGKISLLRRIKQSIFGE